MHVKYTYGGVPWGKMKTTDTCREVPAAQHARNRCVNWHSLMESQIRKFSVST